MDFSGVLASVVIRLADVEWTGWVFDDFVGSRGLFLQGNHWGHVDLRKGYLPFWENGGLIWGRLVAILDLASDYLGCSQLIIRLDNTLEDTRIFLKCCERLIFSDFVEDVNAPWVSAHSTELSSDGWNTDRNDNIISISDSLYIVLI